MSLKRTSGLSSTNRAVYPPAVQLASTIAVDFDEDLLADSELDGTLDNDDEDELDELLEMGELGLEIGDGEDTIPLGVTDDVGLDGDGDDGLDGDAESPQHEPPSDTIS